MRDDTAAASDIADRRLWRTLDLHPRFPQLFPGFSVGGSEMRGGSYGVVFMYSMLHGHCFLSAAEEGAFQEDISNSRRRVSPGTLKA